MRTFAKTLGKKLSTVTFLLLLSLGMELNIPREAHALTIVLDFVSSPHSDMYNVSLASANYGSFGFSGLNTAQIQSSLLSAVTNDFLGYPNSFENASSPLPKGKRLNINFELTTSLARPVNKDPNYYYFAIGNRNGGSDTFFGHACLSCVRSASGSFSSYYQGKVVGSVLVDNIDDLAYLANTNQKRINLLAGTISHEIGHSLSLAHPSGALANPGESSFSLVATGASPSNMPNSERTKDRAFSYSEYSQLVGAIGLTDISPVPEPAGYACLLAALGVLGVILKRHPKALA